MKRFLFSIISLFFILSDLYAGHINFTFTGAANDITKTPDGYWWMATDGGLIRFQRETGQIKVFNRGNSNIPTNHLRQVVTDENGNIWMSSADGLGFYNGSSFVVYNTGNTPLLSNNIRIIEYEDNQGLWIVSDSALNFFDGTTWIQYKTDNEGYELKDIQAIWAKSPYGLIYAVNGKVKFLDHYGNFSNTGFETTSTITGVGYNSMSNLVVSTFGDGIYVQQNDGTFAHYTTSNSPIKTNNIYFMKVSPQRDIYLSFYQNGFAVLHYPDIWDIFPAEDGSMLSYIRSIYAGDKEAGLGLDYPYLGFVYADYSTEIYQFSDIYSLQTSPVNSNQVYDIAIKDGKKYIGCYSGSLMYSGELDVLDQNNYLLEKYNADDDLFFSNHVPEMVEVDYFGNVWIADRYDLNAASGPTGLAKIHNGNLTVYEGNDMGVENARMLSLQWVTDTTPNGEVYGTLWSAVYSNDYYGLVYLDTVWHHFPNSHPQYPWSFTQMVHDSLGTWFAGHGAYRYVNGEFITYWDETPLKVTTSVIRDKYGTLWFGAVPNESMDWPGGIVRRDGLGNWSVLNSANSDLPDDHVNCLARDTLDNIWVGTQQGGMVKIDTLGQMTIFNKDNSFLDNNWINRIVVDPETNNLWIINNQSGVFVFNENHDVINTIRPVQKQNEFKVSIFPNPFTNQINLQFRLKSPGKIKVSIYDITGKIISEPVNLMMEKGNQQLNIPTNQFPAGIYLLVIHTPEGRCVRKIIRK